MRLFHQILVNMKKRSVQRYLTEAKEMRQRFEESFQVVEDTPPKLEGALSLLERYLRL